MKKKGSEIWVGFFVVIGILLLVLMTLKVEKFKVGKEAGYLFNIYFDSALGLDRNSPIRVAGIHVGNVEKVSLEKGKAKVTFHLPMNITLYKDSKAFLKSEGFLGEKFVEIFPGTSGYPKLEPNGIIDQGAPPVDMEQFLSKLGSVTDDIKDVAKPLGDFLKSVDVKKVEGTIDNINRFSGQLSGLAKDSKETVQKAKDAFSRIEEIGDKVKKGEGTLGKLVADETMYQEVKKTVETLKNVSEKIERGEGTLGKFIKDDTLYQEAKETVQSMKGIAEKVERGEGTLGKLVNDETLMKETEKTLKKIQKAADGIQEQTPITILGTIAGIFF